jgi:hypothetical protein
MKDSVENVHSSSIDPNTCIVTFFVNLKTQGKNVVKIWEAYRVCQSQVKGLTWNDASIVVVTLDCIVILKIFDYVSKALANKMVGRILVPTRCELPFEVLINSNSFSEH